MSMCDTSAALSRTPEHGNYAERLFKVNDRLATLNAELAEVVAQLSNRLDQHVAPAPMPGGECAGKQPGEPSLPIERLGQEADRYGTLVAVLRTQVERL